MRFQARTRRSIIATFVHLLISIQPNSSAVNVGRKRQESIGTIYNKKNNPKLNQQTNKKIK